MITITGPTDKLKLIEDLLKGSFQKGEIYFHPYELEPKKVKAPEPAKVYFPKFSLK